MSSPTPRRGKKVASAAAVEAVTAPREKLVKAPEQDVVRRPAKAPRTKKMTCWMTPEDAAQLRGAFKALQGKTEYRSLTDLMNDALMAHVHLLEHEHNKGKPFPPAYPGDLPTGRPL